MRFVCLGALLLVVSFAPGDAKTIKENCKDQCVSAYHFCLNRAVTSKARKDCKVIERQCRGGCR